MSDYRLYDVSGSVPQSVRRYDCDTFTTPLGAVTVARKIQHEAYLRGTRRRRYAVVAAQTNRAVLFVETDGRAMRPRPSSLTVKGRAS